jgi:hypothetical protein
VEALFKSESKTRAGGRRRVLEANEDGQVVLQQSVDATALEGGLGEAQAILFALGAEGGASFSDLVAVVQELDRLLEADGDEETDNDGGDVEEEVAPGAGGVVERVDVEHKTEC